MSYSNKPARLCNEEKKADEIFDVFLSHAHVDAEVVELLAAKLADEVGFHVWLDRWVLVPGEHWQQEMALGLDRAKTCVACIGQNTPKGWFREEIERALNRQVKDSSFRVIPVILPDGEPSLVDSFLELRTWADLRKGLNDNYAFHVLKSGIEGVPPGRNPYMDIADVAKVKVVREKLVRIRVLRNEKLIDDDIALEYQRRLLDELMES